MNNRYKRGHSSSTSQLNMLVVFFLIGVVVGTLSSVFFTEINEYSKIVVENRTNGDLFHNILFVVGSFITYCIAIFLMATSPFGVITIPIIVLIKGAEIGCIVSFLYQTMGAKGIALNLSYFMFNFVLTSFFIIITSKHSIIISKKMFLSIFHGKEVALAELITIYTKKVLALVLVYIIFSIPEILLTTVIQKLF